MVVGFVIALNEPYHSIEVTTEFGELGPTRRTNVYWQNGGAFYKVKMTEDSLPDYIPAWDEMPWCTPRKIDDNQEKLPFGAYRTYRTIKTLNI